MSDEVAARERKIILLLAAVSFVNILDFVMVIPLGPDFARALAIPTAQLGIIAGSYMAAGAVAGLVGTLFLERFDRRSALAVSMLGLVLATAAGGLAQSYGMLVAARVLAGAFGGPATSIGMAILADVIPIERRGQALGKVMGAFSLASIVGVPMGMQLALVGGWRMPFFAVGAMGLVVVVAAITLMPPMRGHLERRRGDTEARGLRAFLADPTVLLALAGVATMHLSSFLLIPNLSAWVQQNLGFPRDGIWYLYLVGGMVSFVAMRVSGAFVDRLGSVRITTIGSVALILLIAISFLPARPWLGVLGVFVGFMLANSLRAVALNTLSTRVPLPTERARFMSAQSASQNLAAAAGGGVSALVLTNGPGGALQGMDRLGLMAMALAAVVPLFVGVVTARVHRREAATAKVA